MASIQRENKGSSAAATKGSERSTARGSIDNVGNGSKPKLPAQKRVDTLKFKRPPAA